MVYPTLSTHTVQHSTCVHLSSARAREETEEREKRTSGTYSVCMFIILFNGSNECYTSYHACTFICACMYSICLHVGVCINSRTYTVHALRTRVHMYIVYTCTCTYTCMKLALKVGVVTAGPDSQVV